MFFIKSFYTAEPFGRARLHSHLAEPYGSFYFAGVPNLPLVIRVGSAQKWYRTFFLLFVSVLKGEEQLQSLCL